MKLVVNEPQVVESYPYGRLRTKATFSIEFNPRKGFRSVFQTVDPKTGRINNPKKGVYYSIMVMQVSDEGFVSHKAIDFHGDKEFNNAMKFMEDNCYLFTDEQIEHVALHGLAYIKVSMAGAVRYGGCNFDDIKGYYLNAIKTLNSILKIKHNMFDEVRIDDEAIQAHKPKDFNPFRTSSPVELSTL